MHKNIDFKTEYLNWLYINMKSISLNQKTTRLTSPFLDFNNDHIEIYITLSGDHLILSDGGDTVSNLEFSNLSIKDSERRSRILHELTHSYSVDVSSSNELTIKCSFSEFPQYANLLMQCMIKVSDMLMLSNHNVKTVFYEDIRTYFDSNDVMYTPDVTITGKSKFYTHYEFVLPKFKDTPTRFVTAINRPKESIVKATLFSWDDIRQSRGDDSILFAVVNDTEKKLEAITTDAFREYGIKCIKWSEREDHICDFKTA